MKTYLAFLAVIAAAAMLHTGCAGTSGNLSATLGPGDTLTLGGSWSPATRGLAPRPLPVLPGYYSTNAAGKVTVTLTNAVSLR